MEHICNSCGEEFAEPVLLESICTECSEEYVCPHCGSQDWEVIE